MEGAPCLALRRHLAQRDAAAHVARVLGLEGRPLVEEVGAGEDVIPPHVRQEVKKL